MQSDIHVSVATPKDRTEWEAFVNGHGDATGYHAWDWQRVFTNAFGHEPVYLIARRDRRVVGVLPLVQIKSFLFGRTMTSLPFLNYGGVMADTPWVSTALVEAAARQAAARRCRHVELRHVEQQFRTLPYKRHKVAMWLRLTPTAGDNFDPIVRTQVRKAEKSGLVVERGGAELVHDFYQVFARNMRDLGTPVYTRRLFDQVLETFPSRTLLHVVRLDGRPVAAGLTYRTDTMVQLPWAPSIRECKAMCPDVLLYWDAIQFAQESGAEVFDLGRCTPGDGAFAFKVQWGAEQVPLHWEYLPLMPGDRPHVRPANPRFHVPIALWQKLPLAISTRVGPMIVRAIP
jgi:FemAB-related protein (PEP-CTERM system-associated)